ncbi:MAG TPA: beta-ketoacyl-[acyl-carrier-protein] synthase II, partial [Planctomycetaceae bacterium]|nr:beta-ketoacyl-[acyl-carrier-protein] synthase II [Planctomycetaceae bacterium]
MMRRVVVTGISVVSPLGCEISEFWDRLCTGKSDIVPLRRFDVDGF